MVFKALTLWDYSVLDVSYGKSFHIILNFGAQSYSLPAREKQLMFSLWYLESFFYDHVFLAGTCLNSQQTYPLCYYHTKNHKLTHNILFCYSVFF